MADLPTTDAGAAKPNSGSGAGSGLGIVGGMIAVLIYGFIVVTPGDDEKKDLAATTALCKLEAVCMDVPDFRDVCAPAGNFEKCMEIKFGSSERYGLVRRSCARDGTIMMDQDKVPGFFACWYAKLKGPG